MSGEIPHRQFSFEEPYPSPGPLNGRRHSAFTWGGTRRPVNAAPSAQPQTNPHPHQRNFSLPGPSSSQHSHSSMDHSSSHTSPARSPTSPSTSIYPYQNGSSAPTAATSPIQAVSRNLSGRLDSLAVRSGIAKVALEPLLQAPPRPTFTTPGTSALVREKLIAIRRAQPDYKPPSATGTGFLRKKTIKTPVKDEATSATFKFKELSYLMGHEIIQPTNSEPGSDLECAATVEALLDMGADANIYKHAKDSLASKMHIGKSDANVEVAGRFIQDAAERGKVNVVWVLASRGIKQASLNEAYHLAMNNADAEVIRVLLEHGADPNAFPHDFENMVLIGRIDIVRLILRSASPIAKEYLTLPLKAAVELTYIDIIELLVANGADLEYNNAEALTVAVQNGRWDILLRMVLNQSIPSREISQVYLMSAVNIVVDSSYDPPLRLILIEILLCAGARGDDLGRALTQAVKEEDKNIINLLLEFDVDPNYDQASSLRLVVSWCQLDLVELLLVKPPRPEYLNLAFGEIPFASQSEQSIKQLSSLLLAVGASGDNVAKLLVQAVRAGYNDLLQLLLDKEASIEYNNSEALVHAITSVDTRKVKVLLKAPIDPEHATIAFAAIDMFLEETVLHELMGLLLARGAKGDPVNQALLNAVRNNQWTIINLLLSNGASVGYANSATLVHAVSQSDEAMLDTLLRNPVSPETANIAFETLRMDTKNLYPMAQKLIAAGATGDPLSKLLISAVGRENLTVAELLLSGGASIAFEDGAALKKAVETGDERVVAVVISKCGNSNGRAAMEAAFPLVEKLGYVARGAIISLFLQYGLRGDIISETLIKEVQRIPANHEIVEMLAKRGEADLSANDGIALKTAVSRGDVKLTKIFIDARPDVEVISAALPSAMDVKSPSTRFDLLEMLLSAGADGDEVSIALVRTIRQQPEALGQIDLLLNYGADVNFSNGEVVKAAFLSKQFGVLRKLVSYNVTQANLAAVFQMAWEYNDPEWQYRAMEIILQAKLRGPIVDDALIKLTQQEGNDTRVFALLLKHGASVNHASGAAIMHAVRQGSVERFKMLLQQAPSSDVVRDALQVAMEQKDMAAKREMVDALLQQEPEQEDLDDALIRALEDDTPSRRLVAMLLDRGASVIYDDGKPLRLAALCSQYQILDILLKKQTPPSSEISMLITLIFDDAMSAGIWKTENGLATVKILLANGASGMCVDKAFTTAAESYEGYPTAKRLVESLLQSPNANVNREDGLCLQIAAQKANVELVELLLQGHPSKRSLSMTFPHIISSGTEEETLMTLAKLFLAEGLDTDLNFQHPSFGPVFFGVLTKYPNYVAFYKLLIDSGAGLESQVKVNFHSVSEGVTPLLWAILQPAGEVETKVIKTFIDAGANVNFKSEYSHTTPLMVAVQRQRRDVVFELIKAGASVTAEDQKGQTALFKACQEGAYDIVELLITRNGSRNDGSLHEAAAFCHPDVVGLLIREAKHDPDFPSSRHRGRSALAELALEADAITNKERLKETVEMLLDNGADPTLRTENRSAIIFGLDNRNPVEMTKLLLNSGLYMNLNSNFNLYKDEKNTVYSPTMYVRKGLCQNKSPEVQEELYQLLKAFRGEDRYYIDDPKTPQPIGYTGIPEYLSKIEEERQVMQRKVEHERQLQQARLRLEKEEASERERIRNVEYQAELVRQADRKAREEARIAKQRAEELAHIRMMNEQKQRAEDIERNRQMAHMQRVHQEEQQHLAIMNNEELKMIEFKVAADRKRQQEIEDASNTEHARQIAYLKHWKGNLEAQKQLTDHPGAGPSQRQQLQWPYTKDDIPD
ncbi:Ankyrin-2 [Dactylellina cionopaga]|nr:Ankyrin-2 [Dactylellina cionopaga]